MAATSQYAWTTAQAITISDWSLQQANGTAFALSLDSLPDSGGQRIKKVEYTTDGGTSWKRLCYGWVLGLHVLKEHSFGTNLTAQEEIANIQVRYVTDIGSILGSDAKSITLD